MGLAPSTARCCSLGCQERGATSSSCTGLDQYLTQHRGTLGWLGKGPGKHALCYCTSITRLPAHPLRTASVSDPPDYTGLSGSCTYVAADALERLSGKTTDKICFVSLQFSGKRRSGRKNRESEQREGRKLVCQLEQHMSCPGSVVVCPTLCVVFLFVAGIFNEMVFNEQGYFAY